MKHPFAWFTPLLGIAAAVLLLSFQAPPAQTSQSAAATYSRGILRVIIPYSAPRSGAGKLTVEVLDPEAQTLGRIDRRDQIEPGKGAWEVGLKLTKALSNDDLVLHRLRYQFIYSGEKESAIKNTESISEILRMPVMRILGQQSYLTGGAAAVRVIVTDSKN